MKSTYDYESKTQVRTKLREFSEQIYTRVPKRKDLKVLTMCGHENHEFEQIWDPLGIKRENIYVIEENPQVLDIIKSQNLGVNVPKKPISAFEYLLNTEQNFDIINLDYMGIFNREKRETLKLITGKKLLGKKGILATWYSGKRESGFSKEWFETEGTMMLNEFSEGENWKSDRGNLISRMINEIMLQGKTTREIHPYLEKNGRFDNFYKKK